MLCVLVDPNWTMRARLYRLYDRKMTDTDIFQELEMRDVKNNTGANSSQKVENRVCIAGITRIVINRQIDKKVWECRV